MNKIYIYGSGGHGKVVLDILLEFGADVAGFIDDDTSKKGQKIRGVEVLEDCSCLKEKKQISVALGIGNNKIRQEKFNKVINMGYSVINALHPKSIIARDVKLGKGIVIMPGAVVNSGSIIEDGVVVNTGATVDHDCHLSRFCQIWPGAHLAGTVSVGESSYIGTGASIIQNLIIGKNVMIGSGAAVIENIPDNVTVVGVPAKVIKERQK